MQISCLYIYTSLFTFRIVNGAAPNLEALITTEIDSLSLASPPSVSLPWPPPTPGYLGNLESHTGPSAQYQIHENIETEKDDFARYHDSFPSSRNTFVSYVSSMLKSSSTTDQQKKHHNRLLDQKENSSASHNKTESIGPNWWVEIKSPMIHKLNYKDVQPANRRSVSSAVYQIRKSDERANKGELESNKEDNWSSLSDLKSNPPFGRRRKNTELDSGEGGQSNASVTTTAATRENEEGSLTASSQSLQLANDEKDEDDVACEYMIISGGFTDDDWTTFPVWAYDMTNSDPMNYFSSSSDQGGTFSNGGNYYMSSSLKSPWMELSSKEMKDNTNDTDDDDAEKGPRGRIGHVTSVSDGYLYVFGGLLYKNDAYFVEESPYIWRAKIDGLLPRCDHVDDDDEDNNKADDEKGSDDEEEKDQDGDKDIMKSLVWEKIIPTIVIDDLPSFYQDFDSYKGDIHEEEEKDEDVAEKEDDIKDNEVEDEEEDKPPNLRHLHWASIEKNDDNTYDAEKETSAYLYDPSIHLTRGEAQGGHWSTTNSLVIYGGLHIIQKTNPIHDPYQKTIQIEKTTGDVWLYQYDTQTFYLLASYPQPACQCDRLDSFPHPQARTSHAATVVNDELIIHGGRENDGNRKNWDGTPAWDALGDVWVFDLKKRVWKQRYMTPTLARSYHSLVGWGDGSVAAFGGFRTAQALGSEPVAFVFSDTIVSHPGESSWKKATYPEHVKYSIGSSSVLPALTISNRLEHSAVINKDGMMYVWGGRFRTVDQISGTWFLNVFGSKTAVEFEDALPDGLVEYETELAALHLLVGIMLFMSLMFTALYGTIRRHAEERGNGGENGGRSSIFSSRSGLSREAIDAIPVKKYKRPLANAATATDAFINGENDEKKEGETGRIAGLEHNMPSSETATGAATQTQSLPLTTEEEEEEECCAVCLVEYEDGDEVRHLPCGHEFHVECIDSWLENHTSCPTCRHALSDSTDQGSRVIRQLFGVEEEDIADMFVRGLGGYIRENEMRQQQDGGFDGNIQDNPTAMFSMVPTMSLTGFLASPESNWFSYPHEIRGSVDRMGAGENASNAPVAVDGEEQNEQYVAEREYIPRSNDPEEARNSRGRLSRLSIPRRLAGRRRGGATEMVTIERRNSSEELEMSVV